MYSNSRNDVPRVVQRYGTIAAHTRRRASVLVVFVVFCMRMHSFADLIRPTPPPTFSDTAITDRHSDTTFSSSELTGCGYPGLLDRKNRSDMCPQLESNLFNVSLTERIYPSQWKSALVMPLYKKERMIYLKRIGQFLF